MKTILSGILISLLLPSRFILAQENITVSVPGYANIFGAGHAVPPQPGGDGGGILPILINLPPGTSNVTFPAVSGMVTFGNDSAQWPPDGLAGTLNVSSYGGISGIASSNSGGFLVGVFLDDTEPADPAPARLSYTTTNMSLPSYHPLLRQTFFIGDGLTGTGTGSVQTFYAPAGATRLYLGFEDANTYSFVGPPGFYIDDGGAMTVSVAIAASGSTSSTGFTAIRFYGDANVLGTGAYASDPTVGASLLNLAPGVLTAATLATAHSWCFTPQQGEFPGTDTIYAGSAQSETNDGYSSCPNRQHGPQIFTLNYNDLLIPGQKITTFTLGMAFDDVQANIGEPYTAKINGQTNAALTSLLNNISLGTPWQGGPLVQLFTVGLDPSQLTTNNQLVISIDEGGTGGDGWAVDYLTTGITATLPAAVPKLSVALYAGVNVSGTIGAQYLVQYSTNLAASNWVTLTNLILPSSPYLCVDPTPVAGTPQRFYRALAQ